RSSASKKRSVTRRRSSASKKRSVTRRRSSASKKRSVCRKQKIGRTIQEFKRGSLKLRNGKPVTNRRQAIAIALSQADRYC
ncbi:hypothetical protein EB077_14580, partial [bacterium]|nr:hypothetical protein [bacterium]